MLITFWSISRWLDFAFLWGNETPPQHKPVAHIRDRWRSKFLAVFSVGFSAFWCFIYWALRQYTRLLAVWLLCCGRTWLADGSRKRHRAGQWASAAGAGCGACAVFGCRAERLRFMTVSWASISQPIRRWEGYRDKTSTPPSVFSVNSVHDWATQFRWRLWKREVSIACSRTPTRHQ